MDYLRECDMNCYHKYKTSLHPQDINRTPWRTVHDAHLQGVHIYLELYVTFTTVATVSHYL